MTNVKCNVKGYVHVGKRWKKCDGCVDHLGVFIIMSEV